MKKRRFIFWLDITQFGLWILVILTILPEIFSHSFVHVAPAVLLLIGAGIHLWMHREWITVAFQAIGQDAKAGSGKCTAQPGFVWPVCFMRRIGAVGQVDVLHFPTSTPSLRRAPCPAGVLLGDPADRAPGAPLEMDQDKRSRPPSGRHLEIDANIAAAKITAATDQVLPGPWRQF